MTAMPRVLIIGGGVAGLSAGMHCAALGARSVTVVERKQIGQGSSALSAGIFNKQTADPHDQFMRSQSLRVLDDLEARGLLSLNRCGYIRLARTAEQWRYANELAESLGSDTSRLVTPEVIAEMVPGIRIDDVHGGMYGTRDGHMDGLELCQAYLAVGRDQGLDLRQRTEVTGMSSRNGAKVVGTTDGEFTADVVINASGGWFSEVGTLLGCALPIVNELHEIGILSVPSLMDRAVPTVQTYFPGSGEEAVYIKPEGPGQFIAGLHSYESDGVSENPDNYRNSLEHEYLERLAQALLDRFPGWEDASLRPGWTGLYPLSGDGRFIIGPHPADPSVIALGGLGGVGLTVSGAAGALAAEWAVLGQPRSFEQSLTEAYLPNRLVETR